MKKRTRACPTAHISVLEEDFFNHRGEYDLIIEQSFFCAIEPELRIPYARHCHGLLRKGGKLSGSRCNHVFSFGPPPWKTLSSGAVVAKENG